ncbi:Cation-transporting P-type ATPase [Macleaya cordata]|uniref:Calcium-transporting ATPase n=1 Tax=Macleaya cordata TaxID=56857 RepID=A0A200RBT6_MACCD|nr:Cation-transporting P-type ATPase [Macleaya cordata]
MSLPILNYYITSITHNAKSRSLTVDPCVTSDEESQSYTALPTNTDDADAVQNSATDQLDIRLDIHNNKENSSSNNNSIDMETLSRIVKEKNLVSLCELGGVERIAAALDTNLENGICSTDEAEEIQRRQIEYGSNTYEEVLTPSKSFIYFVFKASKDCTIVLLLCCGAVSLGSGIKEEGLKSGWYDGTTIFISTFVLVAATSISNYSCWCKSRKLLKVKALVLIDVLRHGRLQPIPISDIVVGDIVFLKIGDGIPADGLFINGDHFKVDDDVLLDSRIDRVENPFLCSGTRVIDGSAQMLVTSVGKNTEWGEMMSRVNHDSKKHTLLQVRLDKLNNYVQNIGLCLVLLILVVLLLRYLLGKKDSETGYPDQMNKRTAAVELMKAVERLLTKPRGIISLTTMLAVLLVGIQQGFSLIITLSLSYWNKTLENNQVIIRELCGCVTMGSVTTICTDKTEGLMLNQMEVDELQVGEEAISGDIGSAISEELCEAICDGVGTAVLLCDSSTNHIEDPLLPWAELNLGMTMAVLKQIRTVLVAKTLSLDKKRSVLLMKKIGDAENTFHLHWRGSAETILTMCSDYYNSDGSINAMDEGKRAMFERVIEDMGTKGLESIALAYRQIEEDDGDGIEDYAGKLYEDGLILLGILGLKYPCCPEARKAVAAFLHAGVSIKLVSPERLSVLKTIAIECGILGTDQDLHATILEGEQFRNLSEAERMERVDQIIVMGSSLPPDKLLFIQCLRKKRQVVAVTGARMSDSPALKEADVCLLMATKNSEMEKESCDIFLTNGSLASMVTALLVGRCAYQNIRKFIQLELTINISGLLINFVTTVSLGEAPITPLQLFLVNLVVGTLAALALLTEPPTQELLEMPPVNQTESLVTKAMWRNILIQVCYQVVVLLMFQFKGQALPGTNRKVKKAMILSGFVLCQIFNKFNAREPEKKKVFKGILCNHWFLVAVGVAIVLQVLVVEFATTLADTARLTWIQWLACTFFAIMSWPIDYVVKCTGPPWPRFTSLIPFTPLTSQSQLPIPLVRE